MDGQTARGAGREYSEGRDRGDRGGPDRWADGGGMADWREKFFMGAENALHTRPKDKDPVKDEQIKKLKQKIGDLVLDNDIVREA